MTHDERVISQATFLQGKLAGSPVSELAAGASGANAPLWGEDWGCFAWCLGNIWDYLPWYIRVFCPIACGGCFITKLPPPCFACLGCVGGYAVGCFSRCWSWW